MWGRSTALIDRLDRVHVRRPLLWFAMGAGAGTLAGLSLPAGWMVWLCAASALLTALTLWVQPSGTIRWCAGVMAVLLAFGARACFVMNAPVPAEGDYEVEAVVLQTPRVREDGRHIAVQLRDAVLTDGAGRRISGVGLYWTAYVEPDAPLPAPGDTIRLSGRIYRASGQRNPEGFDFALYLKQNRLAAGLYNSGAYEVTSEAPTSVLAWLIQLRYRLAGRLDAAFGDRSALPKALLLGERDALSEEDRDAFARVGIAHVLAISGLHISLIVAALRLVLKRFLSGRKQLWFFGAFLLLYALLLDLRASVVRASILTFTYLYVCSRGRRPDSLSGLALAFMIILAIHPVDLLSAGFQLSFAAALGIVLLDEPISRALSRVFGRRLGGMLSATAAAVAGTALPSIQTYHCFSLAGLVVSPLVCALLACLLPLCLLVLTVSLVWSAAAGYLAMPVGWLLTALSDGVSAIAEWPMMSVNCPEIPWPFWPMILVAIALFSSYAPDRFRGRRRLAVLSALFVFGSVLHICTLDNGVSYLQLDVGSEDCAVIQDGRHTTVIDCGEDGRDLCDYLLARGRHPDVLVLTHLHADHCLGAQALMDSEVPIDLLILPENAEQMAVSGEVMALLEALKAYCGQVRHVAAGDVWGTDRTNAAVLWPEPGMTRLNQDPNDFCLCLRYTLRNTVFLLTGDLPGEYEPQIHCDADVLKVAHHGSKTSSTEAFLSEVTPKTALISVSSNREAADGISPVRQRLTDCGAQVYSTGACGAVRIDVSERGYTVTKWIGEGAR